MLVVPSIGKSRLCDSVFFFKQKTAYEMRISDWSSDVCSSDLPARSRSFSPTAPCCTTTRPTPPSPSGRHGNPTRRTSMLKGIPPLLGPDLLHVLDRKSVV